MIFLFFLILVIIATGAFIFLSFRNNSGIKKQENKHTSYYSNIQEILNELSTLPKDSKTGIGKYLFIDIETTGLPIKEKDLPENFENWPYIVEIAWFLTDKDGLMVDGSHYIVKQDIDIPLEASSIHHITTEKMQSEGESLQTVYSEFIDAANKSEYVISHNIEFDLPIIECELLRNGFPKTLSDKKQFCTMKAGKEFCVVFDQKGKRKYPKLVELFGDLYFDNHYLKIEGTHNALSDTIMLYRCFMKMIELRPNIIEYKEYSTKSTPNRKSSGIIIPADMQHKPLSGEILQKDLSNADPQSPFYNKKIVITGEFPIDRYELALILKIKMGADIDLNVGKNTQFLLMGNDPGPAKVGKALQANIEIYDIDKTMEIIKSYK